MSDWSSYDGFGEQTKKSSRPRKHLPLDDKHGRPMSASAPADQPMRRFRENIDIDKLELFMAEHDKYAVFIKALHDPDHARLTFASICRKYGVSLHELQSLYTDGMRHMGLLNVANHLPQVMQDVAEDSLSKWVVCPRCDDKKVLTEVVERDAETGKPTKTQERMCPVCDGEGKVRQSGDKHARDLVFESMKLTGQKGPLVAIQQNFGGSDGLDSKMENMLKMTQAVVLGDGGRKVESNGETQS